MSYKEIEELVASMRTITRRPICKRPSSTGDLRHRLGKRYPRVVESWRSNWPRLSSFLRYPEPIRRMIYTTNIIEGYHAQLRKATKTKRIFDGDLAVLKLIYLVQQRIANEQWANPLLNWRTIYLSIEILFKDRLTHLD
ncbi:MAG: transposase [Flavobacteriales bacterium]|nr:transposase [Flavobacteriales bacterium]